MINITIGISIHAPIVGCDEFVFLLILIHILFQSTHPSWGATICVLYVCHVSAISIHAPIVGCDQGPLPSYSSFLNFNPRTHRGVRRGARGNITRLIQISIHAPIVGCDRASNETARQSAISIHAPIVGCDDLLLVRQLQK